MTAPAILSYGRPRRRLARVPLLFRARDCEDEDGIFALSYGKRVGLVHTRTGANGLATMADESGRLVRVPSDWPRLSWEMTTAGSRVRTLLLGPARTNLVTRSQEFDQWTLGTTSVSTNAARAPDGSTTADLLTASLTTSQVSRVVTFTGDGEKVFSVFLKAGTTTRSQAYIRDSTTATTLHAVRITWTAGVPTLTSDGGAGVGTMFPVEYWFDSGMWRIAFTATGVVAANTNVVALLADNLVGTGTLYAWGAQAENAATPSSYIPTAGATVARAADSAYFPHLALPQGMTIYTQQVNLGNFLASGAPKRFLHIGVSSIGTDPRLVCYGSSVNGNAGIQYDDGVTVVSAEINPGAVLGDTIETRAELSDSWTVRSHVAKNGAAELSSAETTASGAAAAWAGSPDTKVFLAGLSSESGISAFESLVLDFGTQELDELRELVEVA